MKTVFYKLVVYVIFMLPTNICAQTATSLQVNDTRNVNEPPSYFKGEVRADLKQISTIGIGVPNGFSTNITVSPWIDASAGFVHQLNFNNNGLFYRSGDISNTSWNNWSKLVVSDLEGNIEIVGHPESQDDQSTISYALSNTGINGGLHTWKMSTASAAGGWGVGSNGYEIWEYPANATQDDCCKRRFVIQTSRTQGDSYSAVIIGPRGGINIGYPYNYIATDVNDLSVSGNVGIGTLDTKGYKLAVNGTIRAKEIKVESDWADFVFKKGYNLPTLKEVKEHIEKKGTLPGVPSEKEVKANGVNLAETDVLLLQKIEELTLYIIDLKQEVEDLKSQIKK
jgi:hypothetical protein